MDNSYQLPVLMYHRIVKIRSDAGKHNIYVLEKSFRKQMRYLRENNYEPITFSDIDKNPEMDINKKVILTFDDGYIDNYTLLFPILKEFGFKAVIFLVTGLPKNEWGIREGEPSIDLLNKTQIKEMFNYGIEFGSHTRSHVNLTDIDDLLQFKEMTGSKKEIEEIIQTSINSISYPYGAVNTLTKFITADAGFKYGIATKSGVKNFKDDLLEIRRIEVSCNTRFFRFKKKVSGYYFKHSFLFW